MPTTLAPTDLCNVALSRIGGQAITSIQDQTSQAALLCNTNFNLAYLSASRESRWNCLMTPAVLTQVPQTPIPGQSPPSPAPNWAPNTAYLANTYLTYGGYVYQVAYNYTSTNNFLNDLTTGALVQTNYPTYGNTFGFNGGSCYPSGWGYEYALPSDFQLLVALNDNVYWDFYGSGGADYEIMGTNLYTDWSQAVIQYVKNQPDTTQFDSLFTDAVTFKLASMISTALRSDGGKMQMEMEEMYEKVIRKARVKNAGEQQARRFNPIRSSLWNAARWGGTNGSVYIPRFLAKLLR